LTERLKAPGDSSLASTMCGKHTTIVMSNIKVFAHITFLL